MKLGDLTSVTGYITKEKYIAGRTAQDMEKILGFHAGRLANGIIIIALLELPAIDEFDLAAYTNIAGHNYQEPTHLDIVKLKAHARATWTTIGFERLVKVQANMPHNPNLGPDIQYPPGHGAPQWKTKRPLRGKIVGIVTSYPDGRYVAADIVRRF